MRMGAGEGEKTFGNSYQLETRLGYAKKNLVGVVFGSRKSSERRSQRNRSSGGKTMGEAAGRGGSFFHGKEKDLWGKNHEQRVLEH